MIGCTESLFRRAGIRRLCFGLLFASYSWVAQAQYCAVGSTYFAANYLGGCTVGSCWAGSPFPGSTSISGSYPGTNFACAKATPPSGALENTRRNYDNNGNATSTVDPLGRTTSMSFDAMNRALQAVDPNLGVTRFAYDPAGNLMQVTDARTNATMYTYDGLGNQTKLTSPDTGVTTHSYDAAGNLLTRLDARGVTVTTTYDVLNRPTQITYSKSGTPTENHTYTYDVGANAKGRLTQLLDPAATTSWTYNAQGRVASKTQFTGSVTRTTQYSYNAAGQLATLTTPSGQQLGYTYLNGRVLGVTINGATLVSGIVATSFGPLGAWQWGNGLYTFRYYDGDGRLTSWEFRNGATVLRQDLTIDVAGRITGRAEPLAPTQSSTYQYDALDRLSVAQLGSPVTQTLQYAYDNLGNRTTATVDAAASSLNYAGSSNQLQSWIGMVNASYLNGAALLTFTYNNANRLTQAQSGVVPLASYAVNGLGQRVKKTVGTATTYFAYDEQGRLLGEYDGTGQLIQETVWLEDLPIATLRPTGTGNPTPIAIYYVHADHLGSPRAITRPADNAIMWKWDNSDPFGANAANENPAGQGAFQYALRFPGQYYDTEVGTHYNYFRDYDPAIGRYEQSDPLGLRGGANTYGYVAGDPLTGMDPRGLIRIHGQWCGPDWSGGHGGQYSPAPPGYYNPPIGINDAACQRHDVCYEACRKSYPCTSKQRGQCMTECDRGLAAAISFGMGSDTSNFGSTMIWGWMRFNVWPNPGPDDPSCDKCK